MPGELAREGNGFGVQGFAPDTIVSVANGSVDTSTWLAFCFPNDDVTYQLNGAGTAATLPAGNIRVLKSFITSVTFSGISTTAPCEVMK